MRIKLSFKYLIFLLVISFSIPALGQNYELPIDETGKVVFTDVIPLEEMSKVDIYKKAKMWIVSTLKSGDNMVELDGTNSDKIIGTGNIIIPEEEIFSSHHESLNFKFIVMCKDNRLKYSVENFTLHLTMFNYNSVTSIEAIRDYKGTIGKKRQIQFESEVKAAVKKNIELLVNEFVIHMNKTENDDW
ncbi:DUF4468 domain-containing protein [Carboxylicivirga marina]|uniref:DUF4468 domain-containing protein n=1 Tax=Carboxylicivirga marina TaxID=2800988 RepID=UPI002598B227|nr:DUF4468 domain-containing protein [uncultured Carboxylicivirga sp.]